MIAELGHLALILSLCAALLMTVSPLAAARLRPVTVLQVQRRSAAMTLLLTASSAAALMACFALNDFSVRYVASHSHSTLPMAYRLAALWGSHEGSMLLWVLTLAAWTAAVAWHAGGLPAGMAVRVLAVLGSTATGLLLFVLLSSNPFIRLLPAPLDGADLNALLQDPGMAFHPPALYLGYVGFAVPFAFAVAALWRGAMRPAWIAWLRPWVLLAWAALGVGIVLGSTWAYRVLGWGGWWFWDPVENASLLPWLAGVALLHVVIAGQHRQVYQRAIALLAIATFGLSLIGTFIVRSGAITSVHAFATDPARGIFILALLGISLGGALWLYAVRAGRLAAIARADPGPLSRETLLLCNALLLSVLTGTILLATLYPMALDALTGARISVGPPYFEAVLVPLMAPVVLLMGLGPLARWQRMPLPDLARRVRWAAVAAVLMGVVALWMGWPRPLMAMGVCLGGWAVVTAVLPLRGVRAGAVGMRGSLTGRLAVATAHAGVGVFILAVTLLKGYEIEREVPMQVGQAAQVGPFVLKLDALVPFTASNHDGTRATVSLSQGGRLLATLHPESRTFRTQEMTVAAPDIDSNGWRDVYVAMGQALGPDTWAMRLQFKPMMAWVWIGFLMMSVGGTVAAWAGRGAWQGAAPRVRRARGLPGERALTPAASMREQLP